jgi:hypothetical protein
MTTSATDIRITLPGTDRRTANVNSLIPQGIGRRLVLSLLGYRIVDGLWNGPGPCLSEEELDGMSDRRWRRFVARWLSSAGTH